MIASRDNLFLDAISFSISFSREASGVRSLREQLPICVLVKQQANEYNCDLKSESLH
jgi:hypothetical protein